MQDERSRHVRHGRSGRKEMGRQRGPHRARLERLVLFFCLARVSPSWKRAMENTTADMYRKFVDEYDSDSGVRKYTSGTAGYGISYLLTHDYARLYLEVVDSYLKTSPPKPLRVLEFGCGGGMNIIHLLTLLDRHGIPVD